MGVAEVTFWRNGGSLKSYNSFSGNNIFCEIEGKVLQRNYCFWAQGYLTLILSHNVEADQCHLYLHQPHHQNLGHESLE